MAGQQEAKWPKRKALERLQRSLDAISGLEDHHADAPEFARWRRDTSVTIRRTFGAKSNESGQFGWLQYVPRGPLVPTGSERTRAYYAGL